MSDGLYDAHAAVTNSPQTVNHDIALLVQRYLDHAHSMEQVAEKVAAETAANFRAMVQRSGESASMDDVTLIVRNLGYPLGQISRNSTTSPLHQSPFNFGQSSQSQPQLAPTGPAPSYENPSYLQQQQVSPQQTPSAISHHQHPPSSPPSATNPSGLSPYTPPSAAHPSVLTGHLDQVESHPNNSTYSPQSQQGSHYPHVTTGGHGNVQYGPIPAGTAGAQSLRKSSSDPRVHAPFNQGMCVGILQAGHSVRDIYSRRGSHYAPQEKCAIISIFCSVPCQSLWALFHTKVCLRTYMFVCGKCYKMSCVVADAHHFHPSL